MFLPLVVAGTRNASCVVHQLDDERRDILGQRMRIGRVVGDMDLADAGELGRGFGDRADALAGDEQVDFAELRGGGDGGEGGVLDGRAIMFDPDERLHLLIPMAESFIDQFVDIGDLDPGRALAGLDHLERGQARR